jgi:hypothetical protein
LNAERELVSLYGQLDDTNKAQLLGFARFLASDSETNELVSLYSQLNDISEMQLLKFARFLVSDQELTLLEQECQQGTWRMGELYLLSKR